MHVPGLLRHYFWNHSLSEIMADLQAAFYEQEDFVWIRTKSSQWVKCFGRHLLGRSVVFDHGAALLFQGPRRKPVRCAPGFGLGPEQQLELSVNMDFAHGFRRCTGPRVALADTPGMMQNLFLTKSSSEI